MISYKERLNAINTLIFDVDGVFTDGMVSILNGEFVRQINSKDLYAVQYAIRQGYKVFIITGAHSEELKLAFEKMGVTGIYIRSSNKIAVYEQLKAEFEFTNENALYMGDDIPDFPLMEVIGCATCPQDAVQEIKRVVHYQSPFYGGKGAVRDVVEQVMRVQGKWFQEDAVIW